MTTPATQWTCPIAGASLVGTAARPRAQNIMM